MTIPWEADAESTSSNAENVRTGHVSLEGPPGVTPEWETDLMHKQLLRLFNHMAWADGEVLGLIGDESAPLPEARRLFSHVLAAERVWLLRLREQDASHQPIWPTLGAEEMRTLAAANRRGYGRFLEEFTPQRSIDEVEYKNSKGKLFRNAVVDILTHVAMHGNYHRGQIAVAVRAAGDEPVNTDFITFVRQLG